MKKKLKIGALLLALLPSWLMAQPIWQTVGGGVNHAILDMTSDTLTNKIYLCGEFRYAGGLEVNQSVAWDGQSWEPLGLGVGYNDSCPSFLCTNAHWIVPFENQVYVGGTIGFYDTIWHINSIARFDGISWLPSVETDGDAIPVACHDQLFAVGYLRSQINGNAIPGNIAIWNGTIWEAFGSPFNFDGGFLTDVEYDQGNYFFGGNFGHTLPYKEIIKWDGSQWQPLAEGIKGLGAAVNRIKNYQGLLYVGGEFNWAEDNADDYLMAWDGNQWLETFPEVQYVSQVKELEVIDGKLYIVGQHHVFKDGVWNGPYNLAHWDGTEFCSFGGPYFQVEDIAGLNGEIYISTNPATSPGALQFFAKYIGTSQDEICIVQNTPNGTDPSKASLLNIYPNPSDGQVDLSYQASEIGPVQLILLDLHGNRIQTWNFETTTLATNVFPLDLTNVSKGLYSLRLKAGDQLDQIKLVRQ